MAFLDKTGLTHLVELITAKLNTKSDKTHAHDDRYYTESEMNTKLNGKVDKTQAGVNEAINLLSTGTADPTDNDYYIAQYAGGGTTTTTYHRRPISALYNYMKSKFDSVYQAKGSYAAASHTHNYAGSSSAGGSANSAVKLDTASAGSTTQPVYFSGGKPTACTSYASATVGTAKKSNSGVGFTTAGTGAAYTVTVDGIASLAAGVSFTMIPHTVSTTTAPTINVNSLGAKNIRMRVSNSPNTTTALATSDFLTANKPVRLIYDGSYWIIDDMVRPNANELYGTVPVSSGGTGAVAKGATLLSNIGITSGTADPPSTGVAGTIYIKYS